MDQVEKLKQIFIKNSPSYQPLDTTKSKTNNLMEQRRTVAFSRFLYPGFHLEGDKALLERQLKVNMWRHVRYFGPRGELLWFSALLFSFRYFSLNNLKRENIEKYFVDRNVYYTVDLKKDLKTIEK